MLDLPELFAPARIVRGRISMLCSSLIDLNPPTWISAMARGSTTAWPRAFAFLAIGCLSCRIKQRLRCHSRSDVGLDGPCGVAARDSGSSLRLLDCIRASPAMRVEGRKE